MSERGTLIDLYRSTAAWSLLMLPTNKTHRLTVLLADQTDAWSVTISKLLEQLERLCCAAAVEMLASQALRGRTSAKRMPPTNPQGADK